MLFTLKCSTHVNLLHVYDQFHKHFTHVTYGSTIINCTIVRYMHAPMQRIQNALGYFDTAINYIRKMFMKFAPANIRLGRLGLSPPNTLAYFSKFK